MKKYLIINADDFGVSHSVNKAIIEAFKGIENEKNIIINMYNSNFVDKGSEDANKSYLRNIFNSAK